MPTYITVVYHPDNDTVPVAVEYAGEDRLAAMRCASNCQDEHSGAVVFAFLPGFDQPRVEFEALKTGMTWRR